MFYWKNRLTFFILFGHPNFGPVSYIINSFWIFKWQWKPAQEISIHRTEKFLKGLSSSALDSHLIHKTRFLGLAWQSSFSTVKTSTERSLRHSHSNPAVRSHCAHGGRQSLAPPPPPEPGTFRMAIALPWEPVHLNNPSHLEWVSNHLPKIECINSEMLKLHIRISIHKHGHV